MKVSFQTNNYYNQKNHNIKFGSYRPSINNYGEREHNFYVAYDPDRYNATLELYEAKKENGVWHANVHNPIQEIPMEENGISIKMSDLTDSKYETLAYRYKLTDKNNGSNVKYVLDNGTKTEQKGHPDAANILYSNRGVFEKPQNAILIMPDMFHKVQHVGNYEGASVIARGIERNSLRNHVNMLGGNFEGIIEKLPQLQEDGYTKIIGTPFTKDAVSSHKYWTQNAYQIAPSLGTEEDYVKLQEKLVENGMSWVADGAFVNEGLQGVHFRSVLKWGDKSPFANWFYLTNGELEPVTVGILPDNDNPNIKFKLVNPKYHILQDETTKELLVRKNEEWDKTKPSYVQFFDKRLIRQGEDNDKRLITSYTVNDFEKTNQISKPDDTISPYFFEIDSEQVAKNARERNVYISKNPDDKSSDIQSVDTMKALFNFKNFKIDKKKMGGYICWDGNVDIPKLNLHVSNSDLENYNNPEKSYLESIKRNADGTYDVEFSSPISDRYVGVLQVRDYMNKAGQYWTGLTRDIQVKHVANLIGKPDNYQQKLEKLVEEEKLPADILEKVNADTITNIINGDYESNNAPIGKKRTLILKAMETLPLDSLNLSDELMASLSSPYISQRPFKESDMLKTRSDVVEDEYRNIPDEYKQTYMKFDKAFRTNLLDYVESVVDIANKDAQGALYDANSTNPVVNEFGAEVIKMMVPQITKKVLEYAFLTTLIEDPEDKQVFWEAKKDEIPEITPQKLGINASSPDKEAEAVADKLIKGIKTMSNDDIDCFALLKDILAKDISDFAVDTNKTTLNLAKAIVDRGETGLGWRIDAAKDISNIDDVREGIGRFDDTWDNVIDTWAAFVRGVRKENPNAYITAEVTDLDHFMKDYNSQGASLRLQKYDSEEKAELAFLEKTGITSFANYKYLYSGIKDLFMRSNETGNDNGLGHISGNNNGFRESKFINAWLGSRNFLEHGPYDAVKGSYNFYENHDKPRLLHTAALDMELFHGSFIEGENSGRNRDIAGKVFGYMGKTLSSYDHNTINPKAVAMAYRLDQAVNEIYGFDKNESDEHIENLGNGKVNEDDVNFIKSFKKATAELALGTYKGQKVNAAAFGVRPFELVINQVFEQMNFDGYSMTDEDKKETKKELLTAILNPACEDAYKVYKYMATMPGVMTEFAGHKQGASGYESKNNNLYQQNRNRINWEWTDERFEDDVIPCIKKFEDKINKIMQLRLEDDMSALTTGDTVVLPKDGEAPKIMALFRYNDKGSKVISVYSADKYSDRTIPRILLNNNDEGILGGLKAGMTFVNAENPADKSIYKVCQWDNGHCYILKFENEDKLRANASSAIEIKKDEGNVLILKLADKQENKTASKQVSFSGLQAYMAYSNNLAKNKAQNSQPQAFNCVS